MGTKGTELLVETNMSHLFPKSTAHRVRCTQQCIYLFLFASLALPSDVSLLSASILGRCLRRREW